MIRTDFVSNSSSSSFVVLEKPKIVKLFSGIKHDDLNYIEFARFLTFYDHIIMKGSENVPQLYDMIKDFVAKHNHQMYLKDKPTEDMVSRDYILGHLEKFGITFKEYTQDEYKKDPTHEKFSWMKLYHCFDGKKNLDDLWNQQCDDDRKDDPMLDYLKINDKYYTIGFYDMQNDTTFGRKYVLEEFFKQLNTDSLWSNFLYSVVGMFTYMQGDEYDSYFDHRPAELQILENYNDPV